MILVRIEMVFQKVWFNLNFNKMTNDTLSSDINRKQILLIIEHIEKINEMIKLHGEHEDDDFMVRQYVYRKSRLLIELQILLETTINIKADLKIAA